MTMTEVNKFGKAGTLNCFDAIDGDSIKLVFHIDGSEKTAILNLHEAGDMALKILTFCAQEQRPKNPPERTGT